MTDKRRLYIGNTFTGVTIEPDAKHLFMWRVRAEEEVSDMVNVTRAKDAARSWAGTRGYRQTRGHDFNWRAR